MTRENLIQDVANHSGVGKETVQAVLDGLLDTVVRAAQTDTEIELRKDFGSFAVRVREDAGSSNSPHSIQKARHVLVFRASSNLKKLLKQSDTDYIAMLRQGGHEGQAQRMEQRLHQRQMVQTV